MTKAVEASLGQPKYHFRLPWFAQLPSDGSVRIDGDSQAIMEQELAYAAAARLNYWAIVDYWDEAPGMSIALNRYLAAKNKRGIRYCLVEEGHRLDKIGSAGWKRLVEHFQRPDYQTVLDGRPLLFVFGQLTTLGFNPMHVDQQSPHAHIDNAGMLRDIFAAMFPDLGDVQLEKIRSAIRQSYTRLGWGAVSGPTRIAGDVDRAHIVDAGGVGHDSTAANALTVPEFRAFFDLLQEDSKPDAATKNVLARLNELNDYGVFETSGAVRSLLSSTTPSVLRIHATQNDGVQRAVAMLSLYNIDKEMFRRGVQGRITHAVVFDEAHRASRLRLIPRLAAECRKFGLSLILASQSARDFDPALYSQIASYLLLRLTEQDANLLAKNITTSDQARRVADRLKQLDRYHALFFREGLRQPSSVELSHPAGNLATRSHSERLSSRFD